MYCQQSFTRARPRNTGGNDKVMFYDLNQMLYKRQKTIKYLLAFTCLNNRASFWRLCSTNSKYSLYFVVNSVSLMLNWKENNTKNCIFYYFLIINMLRVYVCVCVCININVTTWNINNIKCMRREEFGHWHGR